MTDAPRDDWQRADILELFRFIDWMLRLPEAMEEQLWAEIQTFEMVERMPYGTVSSGSASAKDSSRESSKDPVTLAPRAGDTASALSPLWRPLRAPRAWGDAERQEMHAAAGAPAREIGRRSGVGLQSDKPTGYRRPREVADWPKARRRSPKAKARIAARFLKRNIAEYEALKAEFDRLVAEVTSSQ